MRMRKKKHGAERIAACADILIEDPRVLMADPSAVFASKEGVLCLEIGCGKGSFAVGMASEHPELNIIAMEKVADVCCVALERAKAHGESCSNNLRFIIGDASNIEEWFPPHCLDRIYLNFSDPWPKAGHAKRRLTYRAFLERYRNLLKAGGLLIFKTDNAGLFDFSLEELEAVGAEILWQTRDLHASDRADGNIMTEYEKNFSEKGFKICSVEARLG